MDLKLGQTTVVVTGGAKGIGASTARAFWREGAKVAILDVDVEAGNLVVAAAGSSGLMIPCDVSKQADVAAAFTRLNETFGGVDVLVNNAGIGSYATVTETSEELWDRVLGVNLKSAFFCSKYAIPSMLERGAGVIINVASVQALMSQKKVAAYTTSKSALLGLTRSIAVDYAPTIRCLAICPGTVDTPMLRSAVKDSPDPASVVRECEEMHLLQRIALPEEIAELIVFASSELAPFITGQPIRIDGGLGVEIKGSKQT
jgi:NAD(P)-dependent dehydrogenase (short-subunit alcohol dehydrogenase family)